MHAVSTDKSVAWKLLQRPQGCPFKGYPNGEAKLMYERSTGAAHSVGCTTNTTTHSGACAIVGTLEVQQLPLQLKGSSSRTGLVWTKSGVAHPGAGDRHQSREIAAQCHRRCLTQAGECLPYHACCDCRHRNQRLEGRKLRGHCVPRHRV